MRLRALWLGAALSGCAWITREDLRDRRDLDDDGSPWNLDCDDADPARSPALDEVCGDGVDNDCEDEAGACTLAGETALRDAPGRLFGESNFSLAGWEVTAAGDLDDDGFEDVLVGAPSLLDGAVNKGAAYVVHGPFEEEILLTEAHTRLYTDEADAWFGGTLAAVGDMDADGWPELAVGAVAADYDPRGLEDGGVVYLVPGPVPLGERIIEDEGLVALYGSEDRELYGWAICGGELTGDDLPDLVTTGVDATGLGGEAQAGVVVVDDESVLSGQFIDVYVYGDAQNRHAGIAVASGDLDGDGQGDLVVTANSDRVQQGHLYVFPGPLRGTQTTGEAAHTVSSARDNGEEGNAVLVAPDADGDGLPELVSGAPGVGSDAGAVYVFFSASPSVTAFVDAPLVFEGEDDSRAGAALAIGGDLDGVGGDDLAIGVPGLLQEAEGAGGVWLAPLTGAGTWTVGDGGSWMEGGTGGSNAGQALAVLPAHGDTPALLAVGAPYDEEAGDEAGQVFLVPGAPGI